MHHSRGLSDNIHRLFSCTQCTCYLFVCSVDGPTLPTPKHFAMNNIRIPFALLLLSTVTASAQSFDTLCYGTTPRFWAKHGPNPVPGGIIEFHVTANGPVPVDTLLMSAPLHGLGYTGAFGIPTFVGGGLGGIWGVYLWDGFTWQQWPGIFTDAHYFAGHNSYLFYVQDNAIDLFDGVTAQTIWTTPSGYYIALADLATDSLGNVYVGLTSSFNGDPEEIRCISPQGVTLATWVFSAPPIPRQGMALLGDQLFISEGPIIHSWTLGTPPSITYNGGWAFQGSLVNLANCPTADFTLTDMARTLQPAAQLGLFPNPAQDQFQVVLPAAFDGTAASITIVDDQGRTVWTGSSARAKFMVNAALEPGHYSVVADNGRARSTAGLLVVR